jgi:hypothetical protein
VRRQEAGRDPPVRCEPGDGRAPASSADRGFSAEERGIRTLLGIDRSLGYLLILWKVMFGRMVSVSTTTVVSTSALLSGSRS